MSGLSVRLGVHSRALIPVPPVIPLKGKAPPARTQATLHKTPALPHSAHSRCNNARKPSGYSSSPCVARGPEPSAAAWHTVALHQWPLHR